MNQPYPQQPGQPQGYPSQPGYQQQGSSLNQPYPQQPGYRQQGPSPGYAPQPPQGYGPPQGPGGTSFADVYAQADASANLMDEGWYPALCTESGFGRTSKGDKFAWTVKFKLANSREMTTTITLSEKKNDGSPNPRGITATFRQIHVLGVPVGPPVGPADEQPFWAQVPPQQGETPDQAMARQGAYAATLMPGRQCRVKVIQDDWDGGTNNKIKDIAAPRPGDQPVAPQQAQAPQVPQYAQPQPPQGYAQPGPQPVGPAAQPPWGQQSQAPQGPVAPQPYAPQGPPQQWQDPSGQPAQAPPQQAPQPGQPGMGQFTQQGQAQQDTQAMPGYSGDMAAGPGTPQAQPPWGNGAPQQPQQAPEQAQQGQAPPPPPWAQ